MGQEEQQVLVEMEQVRSVERRCLNSNKSFYDSSRDTINAANANFAISTNWKTLTYNNSAVDVTHAAGELELSIV